MGFPDSSVGKASTCNSRDSGSVSGSGRSSGEGIGCPVWYSWASLVAQLVKNMPAMWENWVQLHGLGRSPGEGKSYPLQYSGLENSMDCVVTGSQRVRHNWGTFTSLWLCSHGMELKKKKKEKKKPGLNTKKLCVQFESYLISSFTYLEMDIIILILFLFHENHWSTFRED